MTAKTALTRLPGTPEPMHRWPAHGGVHITGDAWGPVDGPLVLLQHGGGQTRHAWKGTGEALGEDKGCVPTIPLKVDAGRIYLLRDADS